MKVHSYNEWDPLRSILVGSATNANWPKNDSIFQNQFTTWKESPIPSGPVPDWIIETANKELDQLSQVLYNLGVEVWRPEPLDFVGRDGMYNYCPRDRLLVVGENVVDPAMLYPSREMEIEELQFIVDAAKNSYRMPRDQGMVLDAANICRLGKTWLYLMSKSGNREALTWLKQTFPNQAIEVCDFYSGVHIDSTIVPLQEGLVLLNGSRVNESNLPQCLKSWDRIYINEVTEKDFYQYPYASKWIAINLLVVQPGLVIVDESQPLLCDILQSKNIDVIALPMTHARTLGGSFHCCTLDICRES